MELPLLVITKVAVPVLIPLQTPVADKEGNNTGGVLVGVLVGVFVGVLVGRARHEPTALNFTEERKEVRIADSAAAPPASRLAASALMPRTARDR